MKGDDLCQKLRSAKPSTSYPVSESTLRRHMRSGKVSSEKDHGGRNLFDTAELARVYGDLKINGQSHLCHLNLSMTVK